MERKDKKSFKRDIIVLISFLILFVSVSFPVNIGKEMSLPGFRTKQRCDQVPAGSKHHLPIIIHPQCLYILSVFPVGGGAFPQETVYCSISVK